MDTSERSSRWPLSLSLSLSPAGPVPVTVLVCRRSESSAARGCGPLPRSPSPGGRKRRWCSGRAMTSCRSRSRLSPRSAAR